MARWPEDAEALVAAQEALGRERPEPWRPSRALLLLGGCAICFGPTPERGWAAAALESAGKVAATRVVSGPVTGPYEPGLLALREGPLLEAAVRALPRVPDVLFVHAAGRDHPRRAGLAVQLGAVLDVPTIGIAERALVARADWPGRERGERTALALEAETVGYWLRTRTDVKPIAVDAGWRVDAETAAEVALRACGRFRLPEVLRHARAAARTARGRSSRI